MTAIPNITLLTLWIFLRDRSSHEKYEWIKTAFNCCWADPSNNQRYVFAVHLAHEKVHAEHKFQSNVFEKLIKIVPRVGPKETANSIVALRVVRGNHNADNDEFRNFQIGIEVFVPLTQWFIKNENLRPFCILGEIQKSLLGKTINGMGKIEGGDFSLNFLTEEISCYEMTFNIIAYD